MGRFLVNSILVLAVTIGIAAVIVGLIFRSDPAVTPPPRLQPIPGTVQTPTAILPPPPLDIPAGVPDNLTVSGPAGILIDHVQVDKNLLHDEGNGVVPGDDPGLFVKDGTSVLPATHSDGTVIIGCHAWAENPMVCNPLSRLNQGDSGQVILNMSGNDLVYNIESVLLVDKINLPAQHALADNRPGRLEIITCDLENGSDTFQNRIVVACDASHAGCAATA